ncbi:MAG: peptidase, partial [Gammaproteobacteria bacterium]|nr:peptidase [Gammaproteobacteria bacterium]
RLQRAATSALETALYEYDRRHGYRGPLKRDALSVITTEPGPARDQALAALLAPYPGDADLLPAVVLALAADNSAEFFVRGLGRLTVPWDGLRWRRYLGDDSLGPAPQSVSEVLATGDVVHLLRTTNRGWLLAQVPQVQGAFVALDPKDGGTVALAGGYDFFESRYNRAVQAKRQPGSSFKPFIYSAGLEHGFSVATLINDAPLVFGDSELEDVWRPENYSREFRGPTRMREALIRSLNLVSVRILMGTGIDQAIRHIKAFGFDDVALPRNLSLALGSGGVAPWDIAAGYAVFANGGRRIEHYVLDRVYDAAGELVYEARPRQTCDICEPVPEAAPADTGPAATFAVEPGRLRTAVPLPGMEGAASDDATDDEVPIYSTTEEMMTHGAQWRPTLAETPRMYQDLRVAPRVISPENAFLVYDMMRDVIRRGTGRRARELGRSDIAGKTGTSNDRRDAWFSGFNGALVATAWVGFDQERSLGAGEEGGRTALPMWKYFMAEALRGTPEASVTQPTTLITARISPVTGQLAAAGDRSAVFEFFRPADLDALGPGIPPPGAPDNPAMQADYGTDIF